MNKELWCFLTHILTTKAKLEDFKVKVEIDTDQKGSSLYEDTMGSEVLDKQMCVFLNFG